MRLAIAAAVAQRPEMLNGRLRRGRIRPPNGKRRGMLAHAAPSVPAPKPRAATPDRENIRRDLPVALRLRSPPGQPAGGPRRGYSASAPPARRIDSVTMPTLVTPAPLAASITSMISP